MESDFSSLESAISYKFLMFQKISKSDALKVLFFYSKTLVLLGEKP